MREMLLEDKSTVDLKLPINPDDGDDNYGCGLMVVVSESLEQAAVAALMETLAT